MQMEGRDGKNKIDHITFKKWKGDGSNMIGG